MKKNHEKEINNFKAKAEQESIAKQREDLDTGLKVKSLLIVKDKEEVVRLIKTDLILSLSFPPSTPSLFI